MESWLKRVRPVVEEKEKEIPIYLRVTKTIKLNVKESDSIGHVKALLHDKEGIPVCLQQLLSGDDKLADGRKLVDYGICENSTLHAYVEDSVPVITLYVKRSYAEDYQVEEIEVMATLSVRHVKTVIESKAGHSIGDKPLFITKQKLED
ncbi:Polyubiquitin [Capsicum chinense]|nr:Polyubiquitin [Capsicum chinense]